MAEGEKDRDDVQYTQLVPEDETSDDDVEIFNSSHHSTSETTEKDTLESSSDEETISNMDPRKTWKNICILGAVFIMLFMAYNGLVDLQSSLFVDEGLGVVTQSVVYASFSVSSMFVPKVVISKIGHKWTVTLSTLGYISWMVANGYATWFTMTLTSFFVGVCAAPLWTAQTTYITTLAENYARNNKRAIVPTLTMFFGVFNALFQIAGFCSNIISWSILKHSINNQTLSVTEEDLDQCGSNDCANSNITNVHFKRVDAPILWSLVAVYVFIGVMGLLTAALFLDNLSHKSKSKSKSVSVRDSFVAMLRHHKNIRHLLITPVTVVGGMELTFIWADFNKSYVTCALGVWMVGLVFLPNVAAHAAASLCTGKLSEYIPRSVLMTTVFLVNSVVLCFLYFWRPDPNNMFVFFLVPGLMGLAAGISGVTINSMVAIMFTDLETAYSSIRIWSALGAATSFAINKFLCVKEKIIINVIGLLVWYACYITLECVIKRDAGKKKVHPTKYELRHLAED